ncbi:MAG: hypothetical protein JWN01_1180 [Patescibacteria group bacterium]|nr:hypothetical protein [Patescibacteria group bacterium]
MPAPLPKALSTYEFYILLVLSRSELYAYAIAQAVTNSSFNAVSPKEGTLYPLLKTMLKAGLITEAGLKPAGPSGQSRMHYTVTPEGRLRAKEELLRLRHAVEIGEAAGYFDDETPPEIQRLLNQLK